MFPPQENIMVLFAMELPPNEASRFDETLQAGRYNIT